MTRLHLTRLSGLDRMLGFPVRCAGLGLFFVLRLSAADALLPKTGEWLAAQPSDAYEIEALAAKLTTPTEAFLFVRDQVAYEPYTGVMKGAAGALLTRGANDFDRALLLAQLLDRQGVTVKLAYGTVSKDQAGELLDTVVRSPDAAARMLASVPHLPAPSASPTFEQKEIRLTFEHGLADRRAELHADNTAQMPLLKPLLTYCAVPAVTANSRRVWVQAEIDGTITDLDPSEPGAEFGHAPTKVEGTWEISDIPTEQFQGLSVRLVGETLIDGKLVRHELVAHDFQAADLIATGFRVVIAPATDAKWSLGFEPSISAGDDVFRGERFSLTGVTPPPPEDAGGGGMFGGLSGAAPAAPPATATASGGQLARLWVEIGFHSPGLPDDSVRRMIMDRAVPQGDHWTILPALADARTVQPLLVQVWEGALDVGAPHTLAWIKSELANIETLAPMREMLQSGTELNPEDLPSQGPSPRLTGFFFASGLQRHRLAVGGTHPVRLYFERPRLAFLRHGFMVSNWGPSQDLVTRYAEGIDLLNEPLRGIGPAEELARLGLRAGIADTVLEQLIAGGSVASNTVPFTAAATAQKIPWVRLANVADLDRIEVPAAVRTALADDLIHGRVLLAPRTLVTLQSARTFGWWSLDPKTGYVVGKMNLGGAQAMMEFSKVTETVNKLAKVFGKLMGNMIRCYGGAIDDALGAGKAKAAEKPVASPEVKLLGCLSDAVCDAIKEFSDLAKAALSPEEEAEEEGIVKVLTDVKEFLDSEKEFEETLEQVGGVGGGDGGGDGFTKTCSGVLTGGK
ncbi:MAG TPA: hypothetical protein VGM64_15405 [Lacunisphaera sp.]